ncbi:sensor histidine kinase [Sulfitobacter albidus]|uniref:histidine kinase n=1 Tax=Sulfitobacter albidus TaxID=2829501 RepID=A0A975JCH9_9RHOB|nr:histidine kinase dimerization/phosphoacceptor domain -containing protein [Sulfitobacter albidus]QUJ75952.1 sensor histidine kinase [Sulfitobacter albidus]
MTSGFLSTKLFGGLAFRVLLFLSLALLPIGLIAVMQNREIADQSQTTAELSLIGATEQAVQGERGAIQEAIGAAQALATIVDLVRADAEECSKFLRSYQKDNPLYRTVGLVEMNGIMQCSSLEGSFDFSSSPGFERAVAEDGLTVTFSERGPVSNVAVVLVNVPVRKDGEITGFLTISIDKQMLKEMVSSELANKPRAIVTYNASGQVLITHQEPEVSQAELPANYSLAQLTGTERQVFEGSNVQGAPRVFAVTPIVPQKVFSMTVWDTDTPLLQTDFTGRLSAILPFVMWGASLVVAFWALNRLAIRHIRALGRQMRHFALNRTLPRKTMAENVPQEILAMENAFLSMADSIMRDEARLEDSLREKNILLKEVHHRVKNNLQLISSIMNMQIRQAPTEANRLVLQRLQDRILSLATVHKSLYQGDEMTRVDGSVLLKEIVARNLAVGLSQGSGVEVSETYDSVMIGPDDAAPLTLLVSEAMTNALKHVPQGAPEGARIKVSLEKVEAERAVLSISNTSGGTPPDGGTGLGSRLIQAFARQLNGELEVDEGGEDYTLRLSFPVPLADKETYDY